MFTIGGTIQQTIQQMYSTTGPNTESRPRSSLDGNQVARPTKSLGPESAHMEIPIGLWLYASIAASGFGIGLIFRIPLLIAASAAVAVLLGTLTISAGFSPLVTIGATIAGLLALQTGYLIGLAASSAWWRACRRKRGD